MHLEFWYDLACPQAYLAATQMEALAQRNEAEVVWRPVALDALLPLWGRPAATPAEVRQTVDWVDVRRWADWYGVPLTPPPAPTGGADLGLRTLVAAMDDRAVATRALFDAAWARGEDLSRPEAVQAALSGAGLDGAALVAQADSEEVRTSLTANAQEAHRRGLFGVPGFFVEDQMFWGHDRLRFVSRALAGWTVDFVADEDKELS